jgi:hypothetical protein
MFFGINEHNNYEIALSYNLYPDKRINEIKLTALAKLKAKLRNKKNQ